MKTISDLLKIYYTGDYLNNTELMRLCEHCGIVSSYLYEMGERFVLTAIETNNIFIETFTYAKNRDLVAYDLDVTQVTKWLKEHTRE